MQLITFKCRYIVRIIKCRYTSFFLVQSLLLYIHPLYYSNHSVSFLIDLYPRVSQMVSYQCVCYENTCCPCLYVPTDILYLSWTKSYITCDTSASISCLSPIVNGVFMLHNMQQFVNHGMHFSFQYSIVCKFFVIFYFNIPLSVCFFVIFYFNIRLSVCYLDIFPYQYSIVCMVSINDLKSICILQPCLSHLCRM